MAHKTSGVMGSRWFSRLALTGMCAGALLAGCGLASEGKKIKADVKDKIPDVGDLPDLSDLADSDTLKAQAVSLLALLFPDLSKDELIEISTSYSLSVLLDLREELSAARAAAKEFADSLYVSAGEHVQQRKKDLEPLNDGFPTGLAAVSQACSYDEKSGSGRVQLNGVFDGKEAVSLATSDVKLTINGSPQSFDLKCLSDGRSVDIVFLIDITGSMRDVIHSVRDSVVRFVDLLEASGVRGTVSVVTFQDTVGVNTTFQQPAPANDYERSPFFEPVSLAEPDDVDALRAFVNRLEANRGADAPENLAGAIDFARNNVIGYGSDGKPNVIGDGKGDPVGTAAFPKLESERQVFVVLTDITFHGDKETPSTSSLLAPFVPRDTKDIVPTLQQSGTTVHVADPSWSDASLDTNESEVDADYWAIQTGGLGKDLVAGYSLLDLELVAVAKDSGLLDITLDKVIASSCSLEFNAQISVGAEVKVTLDKAGKQFSSVLDVVRF